jgi:hypothetical protein
MNEYEFKKLRFSFIKKCFTASPHIRVQDWERKKGNTDVRDLRHFLLRNILTQGKSYYTLINHDELLRYPIESNAVTEVRFDLDYKKGDQKTNLISNLKYAYILRDKLAEKGLKAFFYYSGGKGIHAHFLLSTNGLNFKQDIDNINIIQFEEEFKQGLSNKGQYKIINDSNNERRKFKSLFHLWLNLPNDMMKIIDYQMTSSLTLLTLEGAKKRKAGAKYKTFIDLYNKTEFEILEQLETAKPYIEFKFFDSIYSLSDAQIKEILTYETKESLIKKTTGKKVELKEEDLNPEMKTINKELVDTLHRLYVKHQIESENNFTYYATKVLYYKIKNSSETKLALNNLYQKLFKKAQTKTWLENKIVYTKRFFSDEAVYNRFTFGYKTYYTEAEFFDEWAKVKRGEEE